MVQEKTKLYKGKYFLVFYDKQDEELLYIFDNVHDILRFMGKEVSRSNVNVINILLYRALKRDNHFTRFLTGEDMRVYMIADVDIDEE